MTVTVALSRSVDCPFNCNNKGTCTVNTAIANATKDSFTGELIGAFIDESAWEEEKVRCARYTEQRVCGLFTCARLFAAVWLRVHFHLRWRP